jgi:hypothetical protein
MANTRSNILPGERLRATSFSLGNPFQQIARLDLERRAETVECIRREPAELHIGVGEPVRGGDRESRFLRQSVGSPSALLEDGGELKANHGRDVGGATLIR